MFLTEAQLKAEIKRCEYCEEKPCQQACPSDCSPADFIMAVQLGNDLDYERAAAMILGKNPLGGICGVVCPDYHCVEACSREGFDIPLDIPAIQATIIQRAKELGRLPEFKIKEKNGKKVAIIGAGAAGITAAVTLSQMGYEADIFDENERAGGAFALIPESRLPKFVTDSNLELLKAVFGIKIHNLKPVEEPERLLHEGFEAVVVAAGLTEPHHLGIPGEEFALHGTSLLRNPDPDLVVGKRIALVGGAIAADSALIAAQMGASHVEMIVLENYQEIPLTHEEKENLAAAGVEFTTRTRITSIKSEEDHVTGITTRPVFLPKNEDFHPAKVIDEPQSTENFRPFDLVIIAIGGKPAIAINLPCSTKLCKDQNDVEKKDFESLFFAGDMVHGPTTIVEAVASGKNTALKVDAFLKGKAKPVIENPVKSYHALRTIKDIPVPLNSEFFGIPINSPFLLSAAPPTDGYEQMKKAYEAGWAGGIMKTAFDDVPIHIPGEYMFVYDHKTYANCDNVSDHTLDRVCSEVEQLVKEFPDRLTMASTGGPVTGDDEQDKKVWQNNTRKLESAGVKGIEYSLSCPQGGDGTHGDIVSQNAQLTAKIIDWIMETGAGDVPKFFKLTGAVTAIQPIIDEIGRVLSKYPEKKGGVTLANTFPTLALRKDDSAKWEKGIIAGMSGAGVLPISLLTIARAAGRGVSISGNGGPMDYKAAADFLALGAETVQFCTIVEKQGLGIIDELHNGLSYLMADRGISSVKELIGIALPDPIIGFDDLPPQDTIPEVDEDLCQKCGNCTRCPYLAIELNEEKIPVIDEELCVSCSLCVQRCFAGALKMVEKETN
jgi:dihydropyrimidine dehydrogenase (NAD+) subunit PreA